MKKDEEYQKTYSILKPMAKEYGITDREIERLIANLSYPSKSVIETKMTESKKKSR